MQKQFLVLFIVLCAYSGSLKATCTTTIDVAVREIGWTLVVKPDGSVEGVVPDVLKEASRMTGCPVNYLNVPLARSFLMLRHGQIDLIPGVIRSIERDEFATHVPTTQIPVLLVSLRDTPVRINTFDGLSAARIRIDVVRGATYGPTFDDWKTSAKSREYVEEKTDFDSVVQRLGLRRSQAFIAPLAAFASSIEQFGMQDKLHIEVLHELPATVSGFYLSKTTPGQPDVLKFQEALEQIVKRGDYMRYLNRHYPDWAKQGIQPATRK